MTQILLGVKPFLQPSPSRNPGGDCFACSLKAVVDHLYPDRPVSFDHAWEAFQVTSHDGSPVLANSWATMSWSAPHNLSEHGYSFEVHRDIVYPTIDLEHYSHSYGFPVDDQEWSKRVEAWFSAGWVAIVEQSYKLQPPTTPDGKKNWTDHFVVLDGQRSFWQKSKDGTSSRLEHETHVVCSAKGEYWIKTSTLLHMHGVNAVVLLRRYPDRPYRPYVETSV